MLEFLTLDTSTRFTSIDLGSALFASVDRFGTAKMAEMDFKLHLIFLLSFVTVNFANIGELPSLFCIVLISFDLGPS